MKALILAGGKATRLLPITAEVPKCLLPIADKTILGWQIEALKSEGVYELVVVTGLHADQIEAYLADAHSDIRCSFIHNDRFASTRPAHGLYLAREYLREGLIYLNGDVLFEPSTLARTMRSPHASTTATRRGAWDEEQVNVILDGERVSEIGKHISAEDNQGEFVGITRFDAQFGTALADTLEAVPEQRRDTLFAVDAINATIQSGQELYAVDVSDTRALEIDTATDYEEAQRIWNG
jgi:choline kinase